ncbi:hypothetical protein BUALT_Bualt08G0050000 [Buddleja alternifolia]|uniref:Trimethylguanosine synthase n=1 Tax=Buddleja alternifolia TaxID=168488 RepID=A0AAV6X471_9LAMI|nr:hypothetical protein BUALT_Bualt08G0050000 [Buddleja alternifolia]
MDFSIDESPAIKALGPLFSLTEVHLWDDGSSEVREAPDFQGPSFSGFCSLSEDVELAKKLNDLGLPLSFHSGKKRNGMVSGKRKGTRKSYQQFPVEIDENMSDSVKVSEEDNKSHANLVSTSKMLNQSEVLKNEIAADVDGLSNLSLERGDSMSSTACTSILSNELDYSGEVSDLGLDHNSELGNKISNETNIPCGNEKVAAGLSQDDGTSEESCLINEGVDSDGKEIKGELESVHLLQGPSLMDHETEGQSNDINFEVIQVDANSDMIDNYQTDNTGDWIAYWDDFHMRTYFYNFKTEESTWDPPLGMEHLVYCNIADESTSTGNGLVELDNDRKCNEVEALQSHLDLAIESGNDNGLLSQPIDEITGNLLYADNISSSNTTKRKKKVRRTKSNRKLFISSEDLQGVSQEVLPSISKYWCQRYILFSRFDYGIRMDEEGWFSVTPELIAKHHAVRCGSGAIVDFFTGVGGNAIQFAQWSKHVTAIDIDPNKIDYARHNAAIYGVDDNIDFIKGDSFSLAPKLKANTVFMSPPWGGPDYSKVKKFDINTMLKPHDGQFLFNVGKGIAPIIVMFLPRNVDINQLAELSLSATPPWSLEVERNFLNGRLKAVTAYFLGPSKC